MTQGEYDGYTEMLKTMADDIARAKRPDYTRGNADVLHNFRESAEIAGISMLQAWLVHFHKQFSAVARYAKNPEAKLSEPIDSRFCDLYNYIQLGYAIMQEEKS